MNVLPFLLEAPRQGCELATYARDQKAQITGLLSEHGAVLLRGFPVTALRDFEQFLAVISRTRMDYVYRSTPRTRVSAEVFTATEYPKQSEILLHNELAFQRTWPAMLAFTCLEVPASGGQTTLADMRSVMADIPALLLDEFTARGVCYVRHYHEGVDIPWQVTFQTKDRDSVGEFCRSNGIRFEWLDGTLLRTEQICQGTATYPATGERVFFNQAHVFHPSALGGNSETALVKLFGRDRLPRTAYFGDGGELPATGLEEIRRAFSRHARDVAWQLGDVLLLDNMRVAHGRRSYTGSRRVLAALLDPVSAESAGTLMRVAD